MSLKGAERFREHFYYLAFGQVLLAIAVSLFFSDVMKLPPCSLCWYQRIAMYPLGMILAISAIKKDGVGRAYGLPLALTGLGLSIYHNLLYFKFIPASITPCTSEVSCSSVQVEWLGFVTIPLLSLLSFLVISILLFLSKKTPNGHEDLS